MKRQVIVALFALGVVLACTREPRLCEICRRSIHSEIQAAVVLDNGRRVDACCPRCAMHYRDTSSEPVLRIEVTDNDAGSTLALEEAYLVEGSDQTPCIEHHVVSDETHLPMRICFDRCMPSLIAFRSESGARAFIAIHGGTLLPPGSHPSRGSSPPAENPGADAATGDPRSSRGGSTSRDRYGHHGPGRLETS